MTLSRIFLFGPFADPAVLARFPFDLSAQEPTVLEGYVLVQGASNGMAELRKSSSGQVAGTMVTLGNQNAMDALTFYLCVHGKTLISQTIWSQGQPVEALVPQSNTPGNDPWDVQSWTEIWAPIWGEALPEILDFHGARSAPEVATRLPVIWTRAASSLAAKDAQGPSDSGLTAQDVTVHCRTRPHSEFFAVDALTLSHKRFDGTEGPKLTREVFVAADAVTVLPYDPQRDVVLLVEQIRMGALSRGDPAPWLLEPVAGRIEPGDSPETTAHKEAQEEAGLNLGALHHVASYYPSAGCVTEYVHSYVGIADLPETAAGIGGVDAEGEDIRGHILQREHLMQRITEGSLPHGPLVLTAFWLQSNLRQLRGFG